MMPPSALADFIPPESAAVFVPVGGGATTAQVAGRFDTPLDGSFDELHALAVVYVFQTSPERYAALDARTTMAEGRSPLAYRAQGITLTADEAARVRARAAELNSARRKWQADVRAGGDEEERFARRMAAYRWLVGSNQRAFFPRLLSATSVVSAALVCAPPGVAWGAMTTAMSAAARAFLAAASEELMYVGVCVVCAARVLPSLPSLSVLSVARCFVRSAMAAIVPTAVQRNWVLEILRVLRNARAAAPLVADTLGARWAPLVTWLSALVDTDAMECLLGLLVSRAFDVDDALSAEVRLRCADALLTTGAAVLPPWVAHILEVGLDVYKLYRVAEAAARELVTTDVPGMATSDRMHGLVAQLEHKVPVPAFVPKKLARSLLVAAATGAVFAGDSALEKVLNALLSSQPGAASELVRCVLLGEKKV